MPFDVRVHSSESIIEVVYPADPQPLEITDYVSRLRRAIDEQKGEWKALVDQRALKTLSPSLLETLKVMNSYAQKHGMRMLARVVPDAIGSMHAWRVNKEVSLTIPAQTFPTREEALQWLRSGG